MKVGLLSPALVPGDAISYDLMCMYAALKKRGIDVYLFSDHARIPDVKAYPCRHVDLFLRDPDDVFIYHHGIYCEQAIKQLQTLKCRKIVKYHNITPPEFYTDYPIIKEGCIRGLKSNETILNIEGCEFWAASEFNGMELQKIRPIPFSVLYPYNQIGHIAAVDHEITKEKKSVQLAMIGRVVPNKNIEAGLRILAEYRKRYQEDANALIVGSCDLIPYYRFLKRLTKKLGLQKHVVFTGKISQAQLKRVYLQSDLLLIPSKHEGFCVPMVEAMALGLPVVANSETALPLTGGNAVAYIREADVKDAASVVRQVVNEAPYRQHLVTVGKARYQSLFTNEAIEARFYQLFGSPS